ncbi:MAG: hypothetical protein MI919_04140 [Holophagales bacterium]|nr:hypothetical protein [Holophagales bacterium]
MRLVFKIPVLLLLLFGCGRPAGLQSEPIPSADSPAAAYVDELWALAPGGTPDGKEPAADGALLAPDGSKGLVVGSGLVEFEQDGRSTVLLQQCPPGLFDIDPPPPLLVAWSRDSKAVLMTTRGTYEAGVGCTQNLKRLIYIPSLRRSWHVPSFVGSRSEALASAGSRDSFVALPALESLRRLDSAEAEVAYTYWISAGARRKEHLERAIFASLRCDRDDSILERLLLREDLLPEFRKKALVTTVQKLSRVYGSCLAVPIVFENLDQEATSDESFARQLVLSLDEVSGLQAGLLRQRLAQKNPAPLPRPQPTAFLTADGHLAFEEDLILWLQQALRSMAFPAPIEAFRSELGLPLQVLERGAGLPQVSYQWVTTRLGAGYELHTFYSGRQVLLAEVRKGYAARNRTGPQPARSLGSRAAALAGLEEVDLAASPRCDAVFESFMGSGFECYEPTPYETLLIQSTENAVRLASRRSLGHGVDRITVDGWDYTLVLDPFPRAGFSLTRGAGSETWQLTREPDLTMTSGELELVDGRIEVRLRGLLFASLSPGSLEVRREDGYFDCAQIQTDHNPVLRRELARDSTAICTRLAAASVGVPGFEEETEKALEAENERIRGLALVEVMRYWLRPPDGATIEGFSANNRSWSVKRLCAELIRVDPHRREEFSSWIHRLASQSGEEIPEHCF